MTPMLITDREPISYRPTPTGRRESCTAVAARPLPQRTVALVVEADEDFRSILTQLLMQVGYAVVSAGNADDACRLACEMLPTLIVTDLRIGRGDKSLIPFELRRIRTLENVPMVVSSAWSLPEDGTLAEMVGADLFMTTPVDFRAIKAFAAGLVPRLSPAVAH